MKREDVKRNYPWYKFNGEDVVIVNITSSNGKRVAYQEKFREIKPVDEGESMFLLRIADIEAKGIEINSEDVLLSYDDSYAGDWNGEEEIAEHFVKNAENENVKNYEYVTESYWELEQEEEEE
ncbi:MAG: hypothetical protein UIB61_05015 [Treponema sp.]|nr:hypothetical protein [Treponema sp.]